MDGTKQAFSKRQRVLIVENEPALVQKLQDIVEILGAMIVAPERCINDAIEILNAGSVDVVLLDTDISIQNLSLLARSCQKKRIPFALITTYGGFTFDDPALDTAPRLYKPLDECSVRTIVTRALHDRLACAH
jgi:two-component SAPR family response regulator